MPSAVSIYFEKYIIPVCLALLGWVAAEKSGLDNQHKLEVIALGALAALSASIALSHDKAPETRLRWTFRASVIGTFGFLAMAVLIVYRAWSPAQAVPPNASSGHEQQQPHAEPQPGQKQMTTKRASTRAIVTPPTVPIETDVFMERYVNTALKHPADRPQWAVVISDQNRVDFPELNAVVARAIGDAGYRDVALFRPALVRDGKLEDLYSADPVLIRKIGAFCDGVIVGIVGQAPVVGTDLLQVSTIEINMRVRVIAVPSATVKNEFSVLERGAGFTIHEAEKNARERAAQGLLSQLKDHL